MSLAAVLRSTRQQSGIGLRELARRVAVDPSYLSRVEAGKVRASRSLLTALSRELGIDQESLLAQGGYMPADWQQAVEKDPMCVKVVRRNLATVANAPLAEPHTVEEPSTPYGLATRRRSQPTLRDPLEQVLPVHYIPTPELNEIYELKLAMLEAQLLTEAELVERGAYFVSINGEPTCHYDICTGGGLQLPSDSRVRLQSFLSTHQFKTSYATHGLFPYRGKYHPQMIKALLNIMGLTPHSTVLDPMAGSGTTAVEAAIMGINSIAMDISPFCTFMANTKVQALVANVEELRPFLQDAQRLKKIYGKLGEPATAEKVQDANFQPKGIARPAFDVLALAYMDAKGYAQRSSRKKPFEFFQDILLKYLDTIERFQKAFRELPLQLGASDVLLGDARALPIPSDSIDGVIFSPPYSFAVDYLANDAPHLNYLGYRLDTIRPNMIGLNGGRGATKVEQYFEDMSCVLSEVARVLKPAKYCTLVVGSNAQQLARILRLDPASPEARYGIETRLIELAKVRDLRLELAIRRLIVGMANSMREEHILIFCKGERSRA